jgi:hypothetical protein
VKQARQLYPVACRGVTLRLARRISPRSFRSPSPFWPGGLGLDAKNHMLFVFCHDLQTCVVLNANDGGVLATLPIGRETDGGGFNLATMEAFSSQRDGTLTIIKETAFTRASEKTKSPAPFRARG